jgi:hypothetical protein
MKFIDVLALRLGCIGLLGMTCSLVSAQDTAMYSPIPVPFINLLDVAVISGPAQGVDWRSVEIKEYDIQSEKYQELEATILRLWPTVQLMVMGLEPVEELVSSGISSIPKDTLLAQKSALKSAKKAAKKSRRQGESESFNVTIGSSSSASTEEEEAEAPSNDTLRIKDDPCLIAQTEMGGYRSTDIVDEQNRRILVKDTAAADLFSDFGESLLLFHLLDREFQGFKSFISAYAGAVKMPYWGVIKFATRMSGYRINREYQARGRDGMIEHIIRRHNLDYSQHPCHYQE